MNTDFIYRKVRPDELPALLSLYRHLHPNDPEIAPDEVSSLWDRIQSDSGLFYFGGDVGGKLVSTCTLAVIPNLTRNARPYGLIENVVTHPDYRRQGLATRLLQHALQVAWDEGCYKVMLMTGSKEEATLRFYEGAGFLKGLKTGFI